MFLITILLGILLVQIHVIEGQCKLFFFLFLFIFCLYPISCSCICVCSYVNINKIFTLDSETWLRATRQQINGKIHEPLFHLRSHHHIDNLSLTWPRPSPKLDAKVGSFTWKGVISAWQSQSLLFFYFVFHYMILQ